MLNVQTGFRCKSMHQPLFLSIGFLRRLRKIVSAARSMTAQAMMNDKRFGSEAAMDIAVRADVGLRMAALGLSAAAVTITQALTQSGDATTLIIGAGLASTALAGLYWLKRADNHLNPFLAFSASWIAGLSFLAASNPLSAALALATSFAILAPARHGRSNPISTIPVSDVSQDVQQTESKPEDLNGGFILNGSGRVDSEVAIEDLVLHQDELLVDRVHVADRVQFMRAISQLRNSELDHIELELRLNRSTRLHKESYGVYRLHLVSKDSAIVVRSMPNEEQEMETPQIEAETEADKRFLAIVSHELRTPLNAIIGFSDVLRSDLDGALPEHTRTEYVDLIHGAGTHLLSLVNTILDVSKIESGAYAIHREEFDFPQTARDCIAMLGPQAKQKNITINDRINYASSMVNGDRRALKQVLINLLSNAIKYTDKNGFVTVDATISSANLILEVSDTGVGMCGDDLAKVGRPFAQVDNSMTRSNEGTGLGLALVRGLVDLHGGKMEIFSKVGVGTNVKVEIPTQPASITADPALSPESSLHFDHLLRHGRGTRQENTCKEMGNETRQTG